MEAFYISASGEELGLRFHGEWTIDELIDGAEYCVAA